MADEQRYDKTGEAGGGSGSEASHEYSLVNPLQCDDASLVVASTGYQADLALKLKADQSLEDVLYFDPPTEERIGEHTLRVKKDIRGLLCIGKGNRWKVVSFPENEAVLVLRNDEPEWLERPEDYRKKHILGENESGQLDWIKAGECKDVE